MSKSYKLPNHRTGPNGRPTTQEFINHLCLRPWMYVRGGTFREVEALLVGYDMATYQCKPEKQSELQRYYDWTQENYDYPPAQRWLHIIEQKYPDDASRFRRLRFTFNKFVRQEAEERLQNYKKFESKE